jgi:hypothetical protein
LTARRSKADLTHPSITLTDHPVKKYGCPCLLSLIPLGHITFAIRDPESRRGMRTGRVSATWARAQHGAWVDELDQPRAEPEDDDATTTA